MSEEVKKNYRTQGKYSDKQFHKGRDKRLKDSPGEREPPGKKSQKRNSNGCKSNTSYDGNESELAVRYQDNSSHSFNELDEDKKPTELNKPGEYILSETANGASKVLFEPNFIRDEEASWLYCTLLDSTEWNSGDIVIRGEKYPQPRLVAWYGPFPYSYSGVTLEPKEMPEVVSKLKNDIEDFLLKNSIDVTLNSVLLNYYRNGKDSVSWHSDDELTLGVCPTIASISLGETRKFEMRRKIKSYEVDIAENQIDKCFVNLTNGSLIIMDGCMQEDWQHRIPKEYHDKEGRINLTFRTVYPLDNLPTEIPPRKYKNNRTRNTAWDTSSISEKNYPLVGHYDENFPSLGQPIANSSKMDTEREISDHEMDVENKNMSLPNSTSACSNTEENDVSENFESSNISCSMSEEHDNSAEYFDDASQSHDAYTGTDMNNLNNETQTFKHEVNKNVQVFDSPRNDSDTMNPDEESVGLDESYTDSSFTSGSHIYASQEFINKSFRNDSEVGTLSPSGLNVNAKEFVPSGISSPLSSPVSSPISEEQKFDDSALKNLFAFDIREMASDVFHKYVDHLRFEILKRIGEFKTADDDLSFLCELLEDKLISEITQRKIVTRIVKIGNMWLRSTQNNDNFRPTPLENQRERSSSSRGSRFQGGRNDRRPESRGRENSKRQNFNREEEYNERGNFSGRNSERRSEYWESGNSNRGNNSKRGNFNRDTYSRGRSSRGGRYSSNRSFGRGDAHRQGDMSAHRQGDMSAHRQGDMRGRAYWDER